MKKHLFLLFITMGILLAGCRDKTIERRTYMANVPVYMSYEDLSAAVVSQDPRPMMNPGKIYFYQHYIFINEKYKGIHIINNLNPSFPEKIGFINIPANIDLAVKGNVLYADAYTDLIAIDITDMNNVSVLNRDENVFERAIPQPENNYPRVQINHEEGAVIGWEEKEITETREVSGGTKYYMDDCLNCDVMMESADGGTFTNSGGNEAVTGIGGSMARFTIVGEYLYAVRGSSLQSFSLGNLSDPVSVGSTELNREVETLFPAKKDKLFIGTTTGMLIYDLQSPATPSFISQFEHLRNCDPVAVEGDYAYVTLRTGTNCGGSQNQLDVVNIADLENPVLEASYEMTNPHGVGIDKGTLFICDGSDGLKIFDASDVKSISQRQLAHFPTIDSYDVIPVNGILLAIGEDGFHQYDYTNTQNIQLISSIRKGE